VDPTSKEADVVSTSAVLGFFNRIPVVKLEGPAEQALEIFKIEQAVSMDDSSVSSDDSSSSSDDPSFEWAYQHARRFVSCLLCLRH
jgi:hypothetical protein